MVPLNPGQAGIGGGLLFPEPRLKPTAQRGGISATIRIVQSADGGEQIFVEIPVQAERILVEHRWNGRLVLVEVTQAHVQKQCRPQRVIEVYTRGIVPEGRGRRG